MKNSKKLKRVTVSSLLIMFLSVSCFLPAAQAAMIGTGQIMDHSQAQQERAHVKTLLNRADLAAQLQGAGVDPAQLQARVDSLSDDEVAQLAGQLDQLPAGSGLLGTAVFIFLVLLATDILGYTDIFPFVKKTVN
jgi:hypothetical protein